MKWAIVGLVTLGVVTAACAAMLVNALRSGTMRDSSPERGSEEVQVLTTAHSLEGMTVVESGSVVSKTVLRSSVPAGYISDPVQVVDRILLIPMKEGQVFTSKCFAKDEKSVSRHLASLLPKGKRAVGITVSDYAGLEGVLYPGCAVDIMVSGKTDAEGRFRPTAKLLLENIPVWGIEKETIVSTADNVGAGTDSPKNSNHRRITVLVDPKQAKLLEMGMEQGTLSLAMRNPLDTSMEGPDRNTAGPLVASDRSGDVFGDVTDKMRQDVAAQPFGAGLPPATEPTTRPALEPGGGSFRDDRCPPGPPNAFL